jgi:hypothetical protein
MKNGKGGIRAVPSEASSQYSTTDLVQKSSAWFIGIACSFLVACASPPPKPMTHEQYLANRQRAMDKAVRAAIMAGEDGTTVYERLELQACYHDAMALPDVAQRSPAVQQCRVTWPQPVQQVQQTVTTNCFSQSGVTRCTSQ